MSGVPTARHGGELAAKASLMNIEAGSCVVSSVSAEEGALIVRVYEAEGKADTVCIKAPFVPAKALLTLLDGTVVGEAAIEGECVKFDVAPYTIAQVKLVKE